jgi:hypothetical protein
MKRFQKFLGIYSALTLIAGGASASITSVDPVSESDSDSRYAENQRSPHGGLLLVDEQIKPEIEIRWQTSSGERALIGTLAYTAPSGGIVLEGSEEDENVLAYLALGGTRIETGAGHPKGLVIRVGLTKRENELPFFEDIKPGGMIEIHVEGVVVSEPVRYHDGTGMMHLKYAIGDLLACSLPGTARNQYLLSDPKDTLGGRVVAGLNATPGALSGEDSSQSSFEFHFDEAEPTTLGFTVRITYGLLRHLQDPWQSTLPNTFFEPIHLHAEAEVIPVWSEPFDREWELESNDPVEVDSDNDDSDG